ncbi:MAG: redox-sensing transcriptional repressor Rex [Firmicutes bacterium]|jgi:redox-sensing transcriptional repressor|nr:redox-sensing transcriptional repressor Rex [Bacillota bacterium]
MDKRSTKKSLSVQTLRRLPNYLNYLKGLDASKDEYISASALAAQLRLNEVQVRKDLAAVSPTKGKPRAGFEIRQLIIGLEEHLGYNSIDEAILVGAGKLGRALLSYEGFKNAGLNIVAAFDTNPDLQNKSLDGKFVFPLDRLVNLSQRMKIHIGIITVPAEAAQEVCDLLVEGGVLAIWNFAPVVLQVPEHVYLRNENMAASLALISQHLQEKFTEEA